MFTRSSMCMEINMCDEEDRKEAHRLGREYEKMHRRIEDKQWLADAEAVDPSVNERGYVDPRELEKAAGTLQKCVKFLKDGENASGADTMTSTILGSMELLLALWVQSRQMDLVLWTKMPRPNRSSSGRGWMHTRHMEPDSLRGSMSN